MLNKEKYKDKIFEIACEGKMIAVNITTKEVCSCNEIICSNCLFAYGDGKCTENCRKWGNSEYKEPSINIDWLTVPTDTPIYVNGKPKYFAYEKDGKIYCFPNGTTSFTSNNESYESYSSFYENIELAVKPEDAKKYLV